MSWRPPGTPSIIATTRDGRFAWDACACWRTFTGWRRPWTASTCARCAAQRIDVNAPAIQPVAYHYLRASIEALGARERPILDDFAIAVSCLNAACALAVMNAAASGGAIDREGFSDALMESIDLSHADERGLIGWAFPRLA